VPIVSITDDMSTRVRYGVRYAVLGSGSSGNAYLFESEHQLILVDAGYKLTTMLERIQSKGFTLTKPLLIFCTHGHKDHSAGVEELALHTKALVVASAGVLAEVNRSGRLQTWSVQANGYYMLMDGSFLTFATSHDAKESLSFQLEIHGIRFTIISDTGTILAPMYRLAFYSDVLFLESNYSEEMLANGSYPPFLKRRISGIKGHLSNVQAGRFLEKIIRTPHLKQLFLCHISDENNSCALVQEEVLDAYAIPWSSHICPKGQPSPLFEAYL
jgi:phosphoribosyl 1,2-cyclic phosphodiesterase